MGREKVFHKMEIFIKDNGKMICVKEKDFIDGKIKMNTQEIGNIINVKAKVFINGKMEIFMKDNGKMIKEMVME